MANANRVSRLVIKYKWRIRPIVIENVVSWHISENNLNCTTLNGGRLLPLKNFVSLEYIER